MKKFSKMTLILVFTLTLLLSLSLIACGGGGDGGGGGGSSKEPVQISFKVEGEEVALVSADGGFSFPQKPEVDGKHFLGWVLEDQTVVTKEYFKNNPPTHDLSIYAKFYYLNDFGIVPANFVITEEGDIDVSLLSNIISASDNEEVTITAIAPDTSTRVGGQETIVIVTATGKHGLTKKITIDNVKVYGKPMIQMPIDDVRIKASDKINDANLGILVLDSFGNPIDKEFINQEIIWGTQTAGTTVTVQVIARDITGNAITEDIPDVKVYGKPIITRNMGITDIRESAPIEGVTFGTAKDSFGEDLELFTEIVGGNKDIGTKLAIKIYATDNVNQTESITFDLEVVEDPVYERVNNFGEPAEGCNYVFFGHYPQTKANLSAITMAENPNTKGYYLGSDGFLYAKKSNRTGTANGYFRVERILWRILEEDSVNNKVFLFSEKILDVKRYNESYAGTNDEGAYANNYEKSEIRAWLNDDFYNNAFYTQNEKNVIIKTTIDNSDASTKLPTESDDNPYACINTSDNVFLLSFQEVINTTYDFNEISTTNDQARQKAASGYSEFMGVNQSLTGSINGDWILRSPAYWKSTFVRGVNSSGQVNYNPSVDMVISGIVPALWINVTIA
ncbi:MAG: hypothetical protein GX906_00040 [Clostridiales bacterium]|nr:hypothetical protein [Clostridiales bacterium]